MRRYTAFAAIMVLIVISIYGCHCIFPLEVHQVPPDFKGTFRGPIKSDYPTGTAMWGDTLEVTMDLTKVTNPPSGGNAHSPLITGSGSTFYTNGQFKWKFQITGYVTLGSVNIAKLTLIEFQTKKSTRATATLISPDYKKMDFVIDWPNGLKAKALLTRKK
jgi:hypothetical protein